MSNNSIKSRNIKNSAVLLSIGFVGAFLSFLPLFADIPITDSNGSSLERTLSNDSIHSILFACHIGACIPMIIDILCDIRHNNTVSHQLFRRERIFIMVGSLIPAVGYFIPLYLGSKLSPVFICTSNANVSLVVPAFLSMSCRANSKLHSFTRALILTMLISVSQFFQVFVNAKGNLGIAASVVSYSIKAIYIISSFFWDCKCVSTILRGKKGFSSNITIVVLCICCAWLLILGIFVIRPIVSLNNYSNVPKEFIIFMSTARIIAVSCGVIIPVRSIRTEADILNQTLLSKQRRFVRQISHEVRTPINAVLIGLDILQQLIDSSCNGNSESTKLFEEFAEILSQTKESAVSAVGMLTGILDYEKLSSTQMKLETTHQHPVTHLLHSLAAFSIEARGLGIAFKIPNENDTVLLECIKNKFVDIDVSKMKQVCAHLITQKENPSFITRDKKSYSNLIDNLNELCRYFRML